MFKFFPQAVLVIAVQAASAVAIDLELQTRDPATGEVQVEHVEVDPARLAVVAVDVWNWHWCKTSAARAGSLVPRMMHALDGARALGVQVFVCPTDSIEAYVGTPQREATLATRLYPLPVARAIECPAPVDGGGCTCGVERCRGNYGWDGMHPDFRMGPEDRMPNSTQMLYSLCQERGITHLIYVGFHTQVCLLGKSVGLRNMASLGLNCYLARDMTDAHGKYDPASGYTPDDLTAEVVAHFEKYLAPTVDLANELRQEARWDDTLPVDPVRFAPWGKRPRPHHFEDRLIVTLTEPAHPGSTIYYTTDGSDPTAESASYREPLELADTTLVRAVSYVQGAPVGDVSEAYFTKMPPDPPQPDLPLTSLAPIRAVGPGHSPSATRHRFSGDGAAPKHHQNNRGGPLRMRGQEYAEGIGVHAPNQMIFEIAPEYAAFVGRAGIDEDVLRHNNGSNLAMHPSIVFRVFVDGTLRAESPVMKISEPPWSFHVPLEPGSGTISLCATDAGDGNKEDLGDWVQAGFLLRK